MNKSSENFKSLGLASAAVGVIAVIAYACSLVFESIPKYHKDAWQISCWLIMGISLLAEFLFYRLFIESRKGPKDSLKIWRNNI